MDRERLRRFPTLYFRMSDAATTIEPGDFA